MFDKDLQFQKNLRQTRCFLYFSDGTRFEGWVNRPAGDPVLSKGIWGEAAFTTGMSGYQETATDPSFLGQHIIYTTAHVGNYQSNPEWNQSSRCHATCLIARNFSSNDFLETVDAPLISGMDTRALTKYITGVKDHKSVITTRNQAPSAEEFNEATLVCNDLSRVGQKNAETLVPGENPIVLVNYGVKQAIVENIRDFGLPLVTLPYNTTAEQIAAYQPRMIFLSNGPGDPREYKPQIEEVKKMLDLNIPVRGICLGHQLLSLALGAEILKLPFGQRGANHPVIDLLSGNILITSQNHGYATDEDSFCAIQKKNCLKRELFIQHKSLFDNSIEGISTTDHFLKSVQFHPEANPGPVDAAPFFEEIRNFLIDGASAPIETKNLHPFRDIKNLPKKEIPYKKILIIGSGPIKIGQASEFDYSGTQACKSLKSIGIEVVLLNSNPATIMTDVDMAAKTYIEPINKDTIKSIILKEKVDAVLSTMGGQTALNLCVELEEEKWLENHKVKLLGANVKTIEMTEDRELFARELDKLGYTSGNRTRAASPKDAITLASAKVGYPLIIRRDFALGGKGAALVYTQDELEEVLYNTDIKFPVTLEKSLVGYKEVELEVMVDKDQNGVIICSIENVDPCGIHTGDSITVAPAQTISDRCYQKLREIALTIAKHMGVVAGGANVQFAINPVDEDDIVVIEMNPRVSRSSALASKATGYAIAKISALLAVGYTLEEILNDITKASPVAFEPTLDYVAVKIPIFPFNKFPTSSTVLGPQMRSVGEVLALGGSFQEAFMKALRSLELGLEIPTLSQLKTVPLVMDRAYLTRRLKEQHELSLLAVMDALRDGITAEEINKLTRITPWFISQVGELVEMEKRIHDTNGLLEYPERLREYKSKGFSDKYLALLKNISQKDILDFRIKNNIFPVYKAVDTCSGEFTAETPYFYSTYSEINEAIPLKEKGKTVMVMGSGPNRIGQGIEFDYSCVKACHRLRSTGVRAIMINSNPETVSTDYDSSDRLYISPLYSEDLFDVIMHEDPFGVIASFSGQTGIKIRHHLESEFRKDFYKFKFLGSSLKTLDLTEDRKQFDEVTRQVELSHTKSQEVTGYKKLLNAMIEIGPPVIIRPSYVIGGESMYIFNSKEDINQLPPKLLEQLKLSTITFQVENYLMDAFEYDVDLIRDKDGHCVFTVCEHIEHAGVHSGDSGMISPPVVLTSTLYRRMKRISEELAKKLEVIGPINFQYAVKDNQIYCIEANPRGSRTLPFLSKACNIDLPGIATDAMMGESIRNWDREVAPFFCVKQSTFPFDRFVQDNIILGPKMRSTGETLGLDYDKDKAVLKSYQGNYPNIATKGKILLSLADPHKSIMLPYLKHLQRLGYSFLATDGTCSYIRKQGIICTNVSKISEDGLTIIEALKDDEMRMVFNTPMNQGESKSDGEHIRNTAIQYGIPCFTRPENIKAVVESIIGTLGTDVRPWNLQEIHGMSVIGDINKEEHEQRTTR